MRILHLITARAGSKGLPGKNIKALDGKPLFLYSAEFAQRNMSENDVLCISTDDDELIDLAKQNDVEIHFKRPAELASDTASSGDVIEHALDFFADQGEQFDAVMLLQPTSPLRADEDYQGAISAFVPGTDMVVSVKESKENPYYTLYEEDGDGILNKSKTGNFTRRQDCPMVYAFNGSIYLFSTESFRAGGMGSFKNIRKIEMPTERSVDIDTMADWILAEYYQKTQ